jgi:hypothetical protein
MKCLTCKHCYIKAEEQGYSDMTPGSPGSWNCFKGVWDMSTYDADKEAILKTLTIGEKCKLWEDDQRGK